MHALWLISLPLMACWGDDTGSPDDSAAPTTDTTTTPVTWPTEGLVLDKAHVVDAAGAREAALILVGDTIWDVVEAGQDWPDHLEVRDLDGRSVIPGLIDAHVHLYDPGTTSWVGDTVADNLRATLAWGVVAAVDVGGPEVTWALRDRIAEGTLIGPRLRAAGPFLTVEGSHPCEVRWYRDRCRFVDVEGPEVATELAEGGADLLKVALVDNGFTDHPTPRLDLGDLAVIAATGLEVAAHVAEADDEADAAGLVQHLAHPVFAAPRDTTPLDPVPRSLASTVSAFSGVVDVIGGADLTGADYATLPPAVRAAWTWLQNHPEALVEDWVEDNDAWADILRDNLSIYRELHPELMVAGSDAGYWFVAHGTRLHTELEELVAAGWTPLEALTAATARPAEAFGWTDLGWIAAGYRADLLLLDGDPSEDITATRRIAEVWLAGEPHTPESLLAQDLWLGPGEGFCLDDRDCDDTCDLFDHACTASCPTPYAPVNDCGPDTWCAPVDGVPTTTEGACHASDGCSWRLQDCGSETYPETCIPADSDSTYCWPAGSRAPGETCSWTDPDLACEPGSLCGTAGRCLAICDPDGTPCDVGTCAWQRAGGEEWYGLCL